jgi:undecaprenyl-diphosphatase
MTLLQAIILGIVQGLTEFIPISSSAHLIIASRLTGLYEGVEAELRNQQTTATIAVIQLGTLVAVLAYFAPDIWNIAISFVRDHLAWLRGQPEIRALPVGASSWRPAWMSDETWLGWLVILGSIPIGTVGLALKKVIEGPTTKNLWIIATMLVVVALLLIVAEKIGTQQKAMNELGVADALLVGFAQVLSLMPGSSRSGSTIMAGLFAGQRREVAARFSFLLSIPAIMASGLLELKEIKHLPGGSYGSLALATLVAGIVGYASIAFLLRFLRANSTGIFIGYRLILGFVLFGLLFNGIITAFGDRANAQTAPPAARSR